jgi:hypothetical protein
MRITFYVILSLILFLFLDEIHEGIIIVITAYLIDRLLFFSNNTFAFREWALFLYATNYLIAPLITYSLPIEKVTYVMKIPSSQYFDLALPGFLLFYLGMYSVPNKLFKTEFRKINQVSILNERLLIQSTIVGVILSITSSFFPGEIGLVIYLVSLIRFIGVFSLFALNQKKYLPFTAAVLLIEIYRGLIAGMYHDALMWVIFFALFYVYTAKPKLITKITGGFILVLLVLFVQAIKFSYRENVWNKTGNANLETVAQISSQKANSETMIGEENLLGTLNRGNQAWIFASTVNRMDRFQDFQGITNVTKYIESALLPRFLAPNKIKSGDREIFAKYSGHDLSEGTAMGIGVFADGYIAYGAWGVYIFGFLLGLIFSLTFKLVERWTRISPFYVLLLLPMLNYAVRPDCELQTTINHLTKSMIVYGAMVYLTRNRFTLNSAESQRKLIHLNLLK